MSSQTTTSNFASFKQFAQIWASLRNFGPLPQLHRDICDWLESSETTQDRCLQAYRYSGKSYLLCLYVAWRLHKNPDFTCLILSAKERLAIERSDFIRKIIEDHPLTTHLVDRDKWRSEKFTVKRSGAGLEPSVVIRSVEGSGTGVHADLMIGDDVEVAENCQTDDGRQRIMDAVQDAVSITDYALFIGTPHAPAEETIYVYLEDQGFDTYKRPVRNPDGSPAWPERHPEEWIAKKEKRLTTGRFQSQYMLIPARPYDVLMDPKQLPTYEGDLELDPVRLDFSNSLRGGQAIYWVNGERVTDIRAYWDTASGLKGRDNSVVAVCAKTDKNNIYAVDLVKLPAYDFDRAKRYEPQLIVVIEAMKRNFCNAIYLEASTLNNIASDLKQVAADRKLRLKVVETTRTGGGTGDGNRKQRFIAEILEPLYKLQRLYVKPWMLDRRQSDFAKEFEAFPHGRNDDHLDALAGAIHELDPRRVQFDKQASRLNPTPLRQARTLVVNKYQPFAT